MACSLPKHPRLQIKRRLGCQAILLAQERIRTSHTNPGVRARLRGIVDHSLTVIFEPHKHFSKLEEHRK